MPSDQRDWNALAWTYLQSGQSELALEAARRAHEGNRSNLDYLNTLGVAYGENGESNIAVCVLFQYAKTDERLAFDRIRDANGCGFAHLRVSDQN